MSLDVIWTDDDTGHYAVVWGDAAGDVHLAVFDRVLDGNQDLDGLELVGAVVTVASGGASHPKVVWSGSEYAVVYTQSFDDAPEDEIHLARVSWDGRLGPVPVRVSEPTRSARDADIAWRPGDDGGQYGVFWSETYLEGDDDVARRGTTQVFFRRGLFGCPFQPVP